MLGAQPLLFAEDAQNESAVVHEPATPAMAQYIELKNANADCLLFYRMGDFYEMFFSDAEIASRALGIALTKRGKHKGEDIPMAGVPVHAADDYLQKLIALGHRVAVCEQMEDPAEAKKRGAKSVVRRDVVRLVTPGTVTEEKLLDGGSHNFLVALARIGGEDGTFGLARLDLSCGALITCCVAQADLASDMARIGPKEILLPDDLYNDKALRAALGVKIAVTPLANALANSAQASQKLGALYSVGTLDGFGAFTRPELAATGLILHYIEHTQRGAMPRLSPPVRETRGSFVEIDPAARASLELTQTLSGSRQGSLLDVIDCTCTSPGSRLLCQHLTAPLTDIVAIALRHDAVEAFVDHSSIRTTVRALLKQVPDMSRALSRLSLKRTGPRDLGQVRAALSGARDLAQAMHPLMHMPCFRTVVSGLDAPPPELSATLAAALVDDLPHLQSDGGFVRPGFSETLDAQRRFRDDARELMIGLQQKYAALTGIKGLKVKHNNMLGYFVETGAQHADQMRSPPLNQTFIHRQTLASQSRFSTPELADIQAQIFGAADKAQQIEDEIFENLRCAVLETDAALRDACDAMATLDVAAALAELAANHALVRPVVDDSLALAIKGGRHLIVEEALRKDSAPAFIANDCDLTDGAIVLLTGPNMAGKSTYLRQNALIVLLAQMGSFVPAKAAHIGVVDRLYSRVGAADDLARGRSTFMVEMVETAAILHQATARSLVILDEIGRGTATFDGLSIAWACVEHLHESNRCRALFATHFHELTALEATLPRLSNRSMQVKEWQGDLIFLHTIGDGVADGSYGLQVAKLAGLPAPVLSRARDVLQKLQDDDMHAAGHAVGLSPYEAVLPTPKTDPLRDLVGGIDPDSLTPREALDALYKIKQLSNSDH